METCKRSIIFCLVLVPLISGCAIVSATVSNKPDTYDPTVFSAGKKGIAVLRISQHSAQTFNKTDIGLTYGLRKIGEDRVYYISEENSFLPGLHNEYDYSSRVMMLDPGIYCIDSLSLNAKGNLYRWYPSPGVVQLSQNGDIKKYLIRRGAFEVKPGKVSYFGFLNLPDSGRFPFKVTNEIDKAKTDLTKGGLGNISHKLEFQPFYQAGSVLIESNGKTSFITREEMKPRIKQYFERAKRHLEEITTPNP